MSLWLVAYAVQRRQAVRADGLQDDVSPPVPERGPSSPVIGA
jgi:hypothetical protein